MCIDIVDIWFGIANELSAHHTIVVGYFCFMVLFKQNIITSTPEQPGGFVKLNLIWIFAGRTSMLGKKFSRQHF